MSQVSIVRVGEEGVEAAVREVVQLAGGFQDVISKKSFVLIKPNVMRPLPPGSGIITDPRVTGAVAKLVLERRPRRVVIGEGANVGYDFPDREDTLEAFKASGTLEVAEELGVELVDFNRDAHVEVDVPNAYAMPRFKTAKTVVEADVIISVPVLKTHPRTYLTCSLKNMKGVLPGDEKKHTHRVGLDRAIVDLNTALKPGFAVVDAVRCMEGTWEQPRDRVDLGLVLAGRDPVAVDTVCAEMIGLDTQKVLHLQLAQERGLGVADLARIEVVGERLESVSRRFRTYQESFKERYGALHLVEKDACSGCTGELFSPLIYLKAAGYEDKLSELTVIMGSPEAVPSTRRATVVLGKCAVAYRSLGHFIPGCPPHGIKITDGICEALEIEKGPVHGAIQRLHR